MPEEKKFTTSNLNAGLIFWLIVAGIIVSGIDTASYLVFEGLSILERLVPSLFIISTEGPSIVLIIILTMVFGKFIPLYNPKCPPNPSWKRILPILAPIIVSLVMMSILGYLSLNLVSFLYLFFIAASGICTYIHTLKWNTLLLLNSLLVGFIYLWGAGVLGTWSPSLGNPISLFILFSWPFKAWAAELILSFFSFSYGPCVYEPTIHKEDDLTFEKICSDKSIIVVADTHFGLRTENEVSDSQAFADFLKWLKILESPGTGNQVLDVGEWYKDFGNKKVELKPPAQLILLGDILELWTASNESVLASSTYITKLMSELSCEKVYLLGNHDRDLYSIKGNYPLGASDITIVEKDHYYIKGSKENFCFVHGHQFDKGFVFPYWKIVTLLRKPALAFGDYGALFAVFFVINGILCAYGFGGDANVMLTLLLGLVSVPFLFIKVARPIFNRLKTIKFVSITKRNYREIVNRARGPDKSPVLNVIYGHTHTIDVKSWPRAPTNGSVTNLLNIPSWVKEPQQKLEKSLFERLPFKKPSSEMKNEISNVFLYLSAEYPPLFIGWDSTNPKKFYYIPNSVIKNKHKVGKLSDSEGKKLKEINWPDNLRQNWMKSKTDQTNEGGKN